ncbi:unnamed protein product [Rhizophagus irregularis]|nr:unnamed protein product [Rhizophagus irregularis]
MPQQTQLLEKNAGDWLYDDKFIFGGHALENLEAYHMDIFPHIDHLRTYRNKQLLLRTFSLTMAHVDLNQDSRKLEIFHLRYNMWE